MNLVEHYRAVRARIENARPRTQPPVAAPALRLPPTVERPRSDLQIGLALLDGAPLTTATKFALAPVFARFGLSWAELWGPSRKSEFILPRRIVWAILYRRGLSFPQIGVLTARDHTTVLYGVRALYGWHRKTARTTGADARQILRRVKAGAEPESFIPPEPALVAASPGTPGELGHDGEQDRADCQRKPKRKRPLAGH